MQGGSWARWPKPIILTPGRLMQEATLCYRVTPRLENRLTRTGEMAPLLQYLPVECEALRLDPQHPCKKQRMSVTPAMGQVGGGGQEDPWNSLASPNRTECSGFSKKPRLKENKVERSEDTQCQPLAAILRYSFSYHSNGHVFSRNHSLVSED